MNIFAWLRLTAVALLLAYAPAKAAITAEEAARLGTELTPIGADPSANADGSIPEWTGGLTTPPSNYRAGSGDYVDPFPDDQPLYTITAANMDEYADLLSDGHKALLRAYPNYQMQVYQSRRTAALPQEITAQIKQDAQRVELVDEGEGLRNMGRGYSPFPIPKSGIEVIWNHTHRYFGDQQVRPFSNFPVQSNGSFVATRHVDKRLWGPSLPDSDGKYTVYALLDFVAPATLAGMLSVVHESVNPRQVERLGWAYNPGQRRVLRAPDLAYDGVFPGSDGLYTLDQGNLFNGQKDRYDFKLLGKRELLVPYNNYRLISSERKYQDIVRPQHLNQDLLRYELHRVWVVEATLKPGKRHVFSKRRFYIDEDSWTAVIAEAYDARDELWRVQEGYLVQLYDRPLPLLYSEVGYDLQSRRYFMGFFSNEDGPIDFDTEVKPAEFTPAALRRRGR